MAYIFDYLWLIYIYLFTALYCYIRNREAEKMNAQDPARCAVI